MNRSSVFKFITMFSLIMIISSCAGEDGVQRGILGGDSGGEEYLSGSDALVITLDDSQEIDVREGDEIFFGMSIENKGVRDVSNVGYMFSGFDPAFIQNPSFRNGPPGTFEGKSRFGVGDRFLYDIVARAGDIGRSRLLNQDVRVSFCYEYGTDASFEVCVDDGQREDGICPGSSQTYSLSGGQGGPVGINSVEMSSRRISSGTEIEMTFYVDQLSTTNDLQILAVDEVSNYCNSGGDFNYRQDEGKVVIRDIKLGTVDVLRGNNCPSLQQGNVLDISRVNQFSCIVKLQSTTDYITSLTVNVDYGVKQTVTQPILIESVDIQT